MGMWPLRLGAEAAPLLGRHGAEMGPRAQSEFGTAARIAPWLAMLLALPAGCTTAEKSGTATKRAKGTTMDKVLKSDEEWRKALTPEQYHILREKGTERAFTGKFWNHKGKGIYRCAGCGAELFASEDKFDSGCGWPSYTRPVAEERIAKSTDTSHGMIRTEVTCARCGGHLGHVFPDGPRPTGLRYCINSAALIFEERSESPP